MGKDYKLVVGVSRDGEIIEVSAEETELKQLVEKIRYIMPLLKELEREMTRLRTTGMEEL